MKVEGRKFNSVRNLSFGIFYQIISLILSFVCRTILIQKLGSEILGINSLYSNILTLFSLVELGISNVMLLKLYKPIASNDEEQISAYLKYYRKIYSVIALVIFVIGVAFVPFLHLIVSVDINISNYDLIIYYFIFLLNVVLSYLLVYKQTLLNAKQEFYIIKIFNLCNLIIKSLVLIVSLLIFPNYKLYLILECLVNFVFNVIIHIYCDKRYPYIKKCKSVLSKQEKREIFVNVKDTFLYKLGGVLINNTDSIIISAVLSTLLVGYLANYNLVISALTGFISLIANAIFASVGNLSIEGDSQKSNKIFNVFLLVFHYLAAFMAIGMFCTFNDFILLWLKNVEFILSWDVILVLCLNFYIVTAITPIYVFRENNALFKGVKYLLLLAAIINIVLSIIFAKFLGLMGVVLATIVCRLVTTIVFEPPYLYKEVFKKSSKDYFMRQLKMLLVSCVSFVGCYFACLYLPSTWGFFFVKILICFVIVSVLFLIAFGRTQEFNYLINMAKEMFGKIFHKNKKQEKNEL